jgi:hypothetical protein
MDILTDLHLKSLAWGTPNSSATSATSRETFVAAGLSRASSLSSLARSGAAAGRGDARLADARLTGKQHEPSSPSMASRT